MTTVSLPFHTGSLLFSQFVGLGLCFGLVVLPKTESQLDNLSCQYYDDSNINESSTLEPDFIYKTQDKILRMEGSATTLIMFIALCLTIFWIIALKSNSTHSSQSVYVIVLLGVVINLCGFGFAMSGCVKEIKMKKYFKTTSHRCYRSVMRDRFIPLYAVIACLFFIQSIIMGFSLRS